MKNKKSAFINRIAAISTALAVFASTVLAIPINTQAAEVYTSTSMDKIQHYALNQLKDFDNTISFAFTDTENKYSRNYFTEASDCINLTTFFNDAFAINETDDIMDGNVTASMLENGTVSVQTFGTAPITYTVTYHLRYYDNMTKQKALYTEEYIKRVTDRILAQNLSDVKTVKEFYKWVIGHFDYDFTYSKHTVYAALTEGEVMCTGYASALNMMMEYAGYDCKIISGFINNTDSDDAHVWNAVKLNGKWYYMDATADDNNMHDGNPKHDYSFNRFLRTRAYFNEHGYTEANLDTKNCIEGMNFATKSYKISRKGY